MDMVCEKCGGRQFWDNRATKRNPKAPDFKCKNKDCGNGVWLKDSEKAALGATQSRNGTSPNRPPVVLDKMMRACVESAIEIGHELFRDGTTTGLDFALTLNMATTLYISRCKSEGILNVEKAALEKLAAKMEAERIAAEVKAEQERIRTMASTIPPNPSGSYRDDMYRTAADSDLPF